jgi:NHLM bacteriocin system ABC transporter peptidase/ATP-binding protein
VPSPRLPSDAGPRTEPGANAVSNTVKAPLCLQLESVECGAAALGGILAHYGKHVPLEELRVECGVTRDGVKASNIVKAAKRYGLDAQGFRVELDGLKSMPLPSILFWRFNHFVVYEGRSSRGHHLSDPACGHRVVTPETFDKDFTGVVLTMKPTDRFTRSGAPYDFTAACLRFTRNARGALMLLFLIGLLLVVPGLALPAITKIVVDDVLVHGFARWLTPLLLILAAVGVTRFALEAAKRYLLSRLQERIAIRASADFVWKLLHLPMRFFSQRSAGELASRLLAYDVASGFFSQAAPDAILDALVLVFYVALMLIYNRALTVIAVSAAAISVALFYVFASRLEAQGAVVQQERGKAKGFLVQALSIIETIKVRADESDVLGKTMDLKARSADADRKFLFLSSMSTYVTELLRLGGSATVLAVGSRYVLSGTMTLGDLMAFQVLMGSFLAPVTSIIAFLSAVQQMKVVVKRVDDVARYPLASRSAREAPSGSANTAARGRATVLEFHDVAFGYSPTAPPILEGISFRVEPGKSVALVGGTGSGKSTIARLVCGLYSPWSGEIRVNGVPTPDLDPGVFGSALALVDQNVALFHGTLTDNLTMWDTSVRRVDIEQAARDALIHHVIDKKAGGYKHVVEEEGRNFSGGEKQRIEIARALVRRPNILVLDEATSALDTITERQIVKNIQSRGCGCLVIAHRLSTIRECDEIVVLERGRVVDRGSHVGLLARCDRYRELVANE